MNFAYENQGINTYLVYTVPAEETIDTMSLGMITNNRIPGFAPAVFTQMDSTKYIKYNVSGKISADQVFDGIVNRKRLLGIFGGIVDAMLCAEEFMLDINAIPMDLQCIFTDVTTCETNVICLPVICGRTHPIDPKAFFKNVMFNTRFDQGEDCDYVAKIIYYLNSNSEFSLVDFKQVLEGLAEDAGTPKAAAIKVEEKPERQSVPEINTRPEPVMVSRPVPQTAPQTVSEENAHQTAAPVNVPPVQQVNVPPITGSAIPVPTVAVQPQPAREEKTKSWGERRREKAEAKRQKAEEKAAEKEAKKAARKAGKKAGKAQVKAEKKPASAMAAPGFAVPGQETPVPTPASATSAAAQTVSPVSQPVAVVAAEPILTIPTIPSAPQQVSVSAVQQTAVPRATEFGADFGDTDYFSDDADSETVIMSAAMPGQQLAPHLLRRKNNERVPLSKPIFRLGRDCDFNDYAIVDNKYIGHSHCHIITRDGEYFVLDDNSKNHTMVNATIIPSGVEVKIAHGDIVCLADEEFEFKLF